MLNSLDIVLPCYRPPEGWASRVVDSMTELSQRLPDMVLRLILVNDGSPEGITQADVDIVRTGWKPFQYVNLKVNQGKGEALRRGVAQSKGDYCVFTDIDFPYTLESVLDIVQELRSGTNVAIGIKNRAYYAHTPPARIAVSRFLRWLARSFLRITITDTQCGLKGFDASGRKIFLSTTINRYLADLEFIFLADRSDLSMKAVSVQLRDGVIFSSVNPKILLTEGQNFMKVWWRSMFEK